MQIKNVRFIIAAITTFSAYAVYVSRVNLSIAIIAMVDDGHQHATSAPESQHPAGSSDSFYGALNNLTIGSNHSIDGLQVALSNTTGLQVASIPSLDSNNNNNNGNQTATPLIGNQSNKQQQQSQLQSQFVGTFPVSKKSIMSSPLSISQEKFHWDQTEQGHILGAFFYGYILFQIPGARMAELVGARWILMGATAGSAFISLIFPMSTQLGSIHLLMVLRFVMGLCQSAFFPAAYVFFCRWLTEAERSVLLPIMFIGSNMGAISTYIMSSYLISSDYGWPSVFYVSGMICLVVSLLWCVFGSNGPQDNWLITQEECDFIMANVNETQTDGKPKSTGCHCCQSLKLANSELNNNNSAIKFEPLNQSGRPFRTNSIGKSKSASDLITNQLQADDGQRKLESIRLLQTANNNSREGETENKCCCNGTQASSETNSSNAGGPHLSWCKLLSSIPVWTLIFSMYGNEWSQVVLTYELPTYLNRALNIPIEQNGVINSFFQLSYTIASPILSSLGAYMLERRLFGMRKIHVRKLFQSLATFGQLACFVSVPICGPNRGLIIMFMFAAIVFKACANAGDIMVSGDLSPEFAGTIFALANSIGNTAGFFVPILAGVIVEEQYERVQWTPFWLTSASIMGCSGVIFLIFGETRRQDYSTGGYDTELANKSGVGSDQDEDDNKQDSIICIDGVIMQRRPSVTKRRVSINKSIELVRQ